MQRILAAGGGVALGGAVGVAGLSRGVKSAHAAGDPVTDFGNAAVGAERIGIAFYNNALGQASPFGVPGDLAKGTLLNSAHRVYFQAAGNQEDAHRAVLQSLGLDFPFRVFQFPAGTFTSADAMLAFGEQLESVFIGAYLGAIKEAAGAANAFIAEAAAQIVGVECEHRVLIRDIAAESPPNDRFFQKGPRAADWATPAPARRSTPALGMPSTRCWPWASPPSAEAARRSSAPALCMDRLERPDGRTGYCTTLHEQVCAVNCPSTPSGGRGGGRVAASPSRD